MNRICTVAIVFFCLFVGPTFLFAGPAPHYSTLFPAEKQAEQRRNEIERLEKQILELKKRLNEPEEQPLKEFSVKSPVGSVWFLSAIPWELVLIGIAFLSTGMFFLLRIIFEGKCYDRARSSTPGYLFLAGYCATMACYLQSVGVPENGWHLYPLWHWAVFGIVAIGAIFLHVSAICRSGAERRFTMLPAQWWHNLGVMPVVGYTIISTLPIVFMANNVILWALTTIFLGTWAGLVVWDIAHDNMVQIKE